MVRSGIVRTALAILMAGLLVMACVASRDGSVAALQRVTGHAGDQAQGASKPAVVRIMAIPASTGRPAPIELDRDTMRQALRRGELAIQLADGTRYAVRIESERRDFGGRSTFVGRVKTRTGMQSAVLTFGPDAVFGVLPMPDGRTLSISTTNGVVGVALSGGIIPPGREDRPVPDYVVPGQAAHADSTRAHARAAALLPGTPASLAGQPGGRQALRPGEPGDEAPGASTLPEVRIDLLGLYGDDLVAYRGSAAAAETEVASMVAIANQAHIDSGSRVRLNLAAMRRISFPEGRYSGDLLGDLRANQIAGLDVPSARDAAGADLVFILRNYVPGDPACGIAYLASMENRSNVDDGLAYSVSGTGLCGPYTLAHELGHNLGAMHDRATSTAAGNTTYGAYSYSFGYTACVGDGGFATIMAYQTSNDCYKDRVGYFSTPSVQDCFGMPCGEADRADVVRGFNRIATAVAAYRDRPGSLSIADVEDIEPRSGDTRWVSVPIRLTGVAPAGGVAIKARIVGGTATPGVDYEAEPETTLSIPAGERSASLLIAVLPDDAVEGDETIRVHVDANTDVARADAIVTIDDDDPRMIIRGAMRFPGSKPGAAIPMVVYSGDGINSDYVMQVAPPDFRYEIPVVAGFTVTLQAQPPAPYAPLYLQLGQVDTDIQHDYDIPLGARVSGRLRVPQGGLAPEQPVEVEATTQYQGLGFFASSWRLMPGESFDYLAPPGTKVTISTSSSPPYAPYRKVFERIDGDHVSDIQLSTLPSLVVSSRDDAFDEENPGQDGGYAVVLFELSAPAPAEGVTFHYTVAPGSAEPGADYVPVSGNLRIEPGAQMESVLVHIEQDTLAEGDEDFYVDVDDVVGAVVEIPRSRVVIRDNDGLAPPPSVALSGAARQYEGAAGTRDAFHAVVRLSAPAPEGGVEIAYYTASGSATAGVDFVPVVGKLTFAPGETETTIDIPWLGDDLAESDEYFDFIVQPLRGAVPAPASSIRFVLRNDDQRPPSVPQSPPCLAARKEGGHPGMPGLRPCQ
jgi:hypothetical protein